MLPTMRAIAREQATLLAFARQRNATRQHAGRLAKRARTRGSELQAPAEGGAHPLRRGMLHAGGNAAALTPTLAMPSGTRAYLRTLLNLAQPRARRPPPPLHLPRSVREGDGWLPPVP